jgi:ATP-dependent Clp protease ATP-binding subunit ClpC
MFERFTDQSRQVIVLAQEEASLLKHNYIGTEHLLLGLLAVGEGDAARTLESFNITLESARHEVRAILGEGTEPPKGHVPFTPRAKKVLELALREALTLRSQSIGSVHLLLGLISEGQGVGAQIIERLGAPLSAVRERATELSGKESDPAPSAEAGVFGSARPTRVRLEGLSQLQVTLAAMDRRLARIERHLGIAVPDEPPAAAKPSPAASAAAATPSARAPAEASPAEAPPVAADPSATEGPAAPDEPASGG